jgi:hypothetical protein
MKKNIALLAALCMLGGCYYDKADQLYPGSITCDTTQVTYSATIAGIMKHSCTQTGCHDAASNAGGYMLYDYAGVQRIAQNGLLEAVVKHQAGYIAMPPNAPALSACAINSIMRWIHQGAPNN